MRKIEVQKKSPHFRGLFYVIKNPEGILMGNSHFYCTPASFSSWVMRALIAVASLSISSRM